LIIIFLFNIFENFVFPDFNNRSIQFNPAGLIEPKFFVCLGSNERFGLSSLRTWTAGMQVRSSQLIFKTFGNELYRENAFELAGGFTVYKGIGAGIGIGVLNNWIKDYTNRFTYTIKLGAMFQLPNLRLDLCLNNINNPRFSEIDYLPISYLLGLQYCINPYVKAYFNTMGKEKDKPFFNFGLLVIPVKEIEFYTGINTENFLFEYGLEICLGRLAVDYAGTIHRQLGLSHTIFISLLRL